MYERILDYLKQEPRARERALHQRGMVNLLLQDFPELNTIPKDKLVDFCHSFESYCRIWRKVTEENVDLRGTDYNQNDSKQILEERKMIELGYEPNFRANVSQLKML